MQANGCYATYPSGSDSPSGGTITTAPNGARTYTEVTTARYGCSSGTSSVCALCYSTTYSGGAAAGGPFNKYVATPTITKGAVSGCSTNNTTTITDKLGLSAASGSWIKIQYGLVSASYYLLNNLDCPSDPGIYTTYGGTVFQN